MIYSFGFTIEITIKKKKKKNYVWYIVLVFKLDCTYNNCKKFHPLIYYQYKINNFIIILSLHYYPYLHKSPQISLFLSTNLILSLSSFFFFPFSSLSHRLSLHFTSFSIFFLFPFSSLSHWDNNLDHPSHTITSTLLSSQKIILTHKFKKINLWKRIWQTIRHTHSQVPIIRK